MGETLVPPAARLDARAIVRAADSRCTRQSELLRRGLSPGKVAKAVYGLDPHEEQSRLTLALGTQFEARLFRDNAKALREAYVRRGLLLPTDMVIEDYRGNSSVADALRLTEQHVRDRLAGKHDVPNVILGSALPTWPLGLSREGYVRPDALVAASGASLYRIVEIKSYESREGLTGATDIESSGAQAAVELSILRRLVPQYEELRVVDLVLRRPASLQPIVHLVPADRDLFRIDELVTRWGLLASVASTELGVVPDKDEVEALPYSYEPACLQTCGLAEHCRSELVKCKDPAVIGSGLSTLLAPIGNLEDLEGPLPTPTDYPSARLTRAARLLDRVLMS